MIYNRLFVDSDVLLDMLLRREPFYFHTQLLLMECDKHNAELNTSALAISNVHYVLSKSIGAVASKRNLKAMIKTVKVLSLESDIINLALESTFSDFEDAIQNLIAERYNCEVIITRNAKDYKQSNLPVFTTEQFLNTL